MGGPVTLESAPDPFITALVYGSAGVGKSVFAGTSQSLNTFIFDVDNSLDSVRAWPTTRRKNVVSWLVQSKADFDQAYTYVKANMRYFQLVVVDTVTELQRLMMDDIQRRSNSYKLSQQEWGQLLNMMDVLIREMRYWPVHKVFTAHERQEETPLGRPFFRPFFQGQLRTNYSKNFGLIARYVVQDVPTRQADNQVVMTTYRYLNCNNDETCDAKDRSSGLDKIEVPKIDAVFAKYMTAITKYTNQESASHG